MKVSKQLTTLRFKIEILKYFVFFKFISHKMFNILKKVLKIKCDHTHTFKSKQTILKNFQNLWLRIFFFLSVNNYLIFAGLNQFFKFIPDNIFIFNKKL